MLPPKRLRRSGEDSPLSFVEVILLGLWQTPLSCPNKNSWKNDGIFAWPGNMLPPKRLRRSGEDSPLSFVEVLGKLPSRPWATSPLRGGYGQTSLLRLNENSWKNEGIASWPGNILPPKHLRKMGRTPPFLSFLDASAATLGITTIFWPGAVLLSQPSLSEKGALPPLSEKLFCLALGRHVLKPPWCLTERLAVFINSLRGRLGATLNNQ